MNPTDNLEYLLQHIATIMYRQSNQVLQERLGIGMSQYKLLMVLQHEPNVQQRLLAGRLGQTEASISRQIKLLCDKGLLAVQVNPQSRREHITIPTAKGVKVTEAARETLATYHGPVFAQFSEKQRHNIYEALEQIHTLACLPNKPHECGPPFTTTSYIDAIAPRPQRLLK